MILTFFKKYQPSHRVKLPFHVLLAWQAREEEPRRVNPSSQLNVNLFGNTVKDPWREPFRGTARGPQSTAVERRMLKKML
jgi:hypothetical protein